MAFDLEDPETNPVINCSAHAHMDMMKWILPNENKQVQMLTYFSTFLLCSKLNLFLFFLVFLFHFN